MLAMSLLSRNSSARNPVVVCRSGGDSRGYVSSKPSDSDGADSTSVSGNRAYTSDNDYADDAADTWVACARRTVVTE